jgi:hypothetical protein
MIVDATDAQAETIVRAMYTVATADGGQPLSSMDRRGIETAWSTVLGHPEGTPVDELRPVTATGLAASVEDPAARLDAVRLMSVMAFVDAVVDDAKLDLALAAASALGVHADFVVAIEHLVADDVHWAGMDMLRHNVDSIPGMVWHPDDPMSAFLPFRDGHEDPALAARYHALEGQAAGTLGRAFFDHYTDNHFAFPGETSGVGEAWGTPHDCLHILSGYSTSAQGELLVAVFNGASLSMPNADMMESHVRPVIFTYHMGIELNKGINKGDRERMDRDASWRDNFEGNVHLGLDPAKLWVAWSRGAAMSEDLFSGRWRFWDHVGEPVDDLRVRYAVAPLDPTDAALDDARIDRDAFARPGMPLPALSTVQVAERPTG